MHTRAHTEYVHDLQGTTKKNGVDASSQSEEESQDTGEQPELLQPPLATLVPDA
jgi:hypothetical protein